MKTYNIEETEFYTSKQHMLAVYFEDCGAANIYTYNSAEELLAYWDEQYGSDLDAAKVAAFLDDEDEMQLVCATAKYVKIF